MYRQFKKTIRKRLFVIDSFSLLLSFMIGMLVRYGNITSPFSPPLEDVNFPHPEDIVKAVKAVLNK